MKIRNKYKLFSIIMASAMLLTGCSLAKEERVSREADRLVGVYLTTENPDSDRGEWVEYGTFSADTEYGKISFPNMILPAEYNPETREFVFPGLDGYALFEAAVYEGDEVCNTSQSDLLDGNFHVITTDFGNSFELSGTLYVGEETKDTVWKANLVYQTAEGLVYLDGSGNSYTGNEGGFSGKVEQTQTVSANGKEGSISTKVEFSLKTTGKLERLSVSQYDGAGEQIERTELSVTGGDLNISRNPDAAFAVVEEQYADHVKRTACSFSDSETEEVTHTVIVLNEDSVGEEAIVRFLR